MEPEVPVTPPPDEEEAPRPRGQRTRAGMLARSILLPGESIDRFQALLAAYRSEFSPRTSLEESLLETLVVCRWRLLRTWGLEQATFAREMMNGTNDCSDGHHAEQRAASVLENRAEHFSFLSRQETLLDRQFYRALHQLERRGRSIY